MQKIKRTEKKPSRIQNLYKKNYAQRLVCARVTKFLR